MRQYIDDEALQSQGDSYFVTDGRPKAPDLLTVPDVGDPPESPPNQTIKTSSIDLIFRAGDGVVAAVLNLVSDVDLEVLKGAITVLPDPTDGRPLQGLNADGEGSASSLATSTDDAASVLTQIRLVRSQAFSTDINFRVRIQAGQVKEGTPLSSMTWQDLTSSTAASSAATTIRSRLTGGRPRPHRRPPLGLRWMTTTSR